MKAKPTDEARRRIERELIWGGEQRLPARRGRVVMIERPKPEIAMSRQSHVVAIALGLVLLLGLPAAGKLPAGYKEDFNGCSQNSPDQQDRERCCEETGDDCSNECKEIRTPDNASLWCLEACARAKFDCKAGRRIDRVEWPGSSGYEIPGIVQENGGVLQPANGATIVPARAGSVLFEVHQAPERGPQCVGLVVSCQGDARCIPQLTASRVECRVPGEKSATYSCTPVVLSAHACTPAAAPKKARRNR